jgi:hypothetical protein
MMKGITFAGLVLMVSMTAVAQDTMEDGSRVILPLKSQECKLPSGPPPIPEAASKDELVKAQKHMKAFQAEAQVYRTCLNEGTDSGELSMGNTQAITNAHNYSVDMEERVASMFNEALREYKANLKKD